MSRLAAVGTALLVAWLALIAVLSRGFPFGQDDYRHLTLARESFGAPATILGVWARPLMTLVYMPASVIGDGAVRVTSMALLCATAVLCWRIAVRLELAIAPAAALLLLSQPAALVMGVGALPGTLFSLVLAVALLARVRGQHVTAALVASLLPLARLEGLVVLLVLAVVLAWERRWRLIPLLGIGMLAWAAVGAVVFHDPLHLWHDNYYGVLGSRYQGSRPLYLFRAWLPGFGPVVGLLAVAGLLFARRIDRAIPAVLLVMSAFFVAIWALPAFESYPTPFYLVSISVPAALCAAVCLDRVVRGDARLPRPRLVAAALLLVAVTATFLLARPVPLAGEPKLAQELAGYVLGHGIQVTESTTPAFTWYSSQGFDNPGPGYARFARRAPSGTYIVWDHDWGQGIIGRDRLLALGWRPVWDRFGPDGGEVVLLERP